MLLCATIFVCIYGYPASHLVKRMRRYLLCLYVFVLLMPACAQDEQSVVPVGDAWRQLSLYEQQQVVERYEHSKREPVDAYAWRLLLKKGSDVFVRVSANAPEKPLKAQLGSITLHDGDCGMLNTTHTPLKLKVCWRDQQLTLSSVSHQRVPAIMRIHSHPLWSFGLTYPHLALADVNLYVQTVGV